MKRVYDSFFKKTQNKCIGLAAAFVNKSKPASEQLKEPLLFQKPLTSLVKNPSQIVLRTQAKMNHEIELGLVINKAGIDIPEDKALEYIGGYFLCLDLTASNIGDYRKAGRSFCIPKMGDNYLPVGDFINKEEIDNPDNVDLELKINGEFRQGGNTKDLLYNVAKEIAYISRFSTLNPGDLILTGTPDPIMSFEDGSFLEATMSYKGKVLSQLKLRTDFKLI